MRTTSGPAGVASTPSSIIASTTSFATGRSSWKPHRHPRPRDSTTAPSGAAATAAPGSNSPIRFARSIRWTVEHGHANNFANDYSSVAYWYQTEPHAPFPELPSRDAMRPPLAPPYAEAREALGAAFRRALAEKPIQAALESLAAAGESFYAGRFAEALRKL